MIRELFKKHQDKLLVFANTGWGREFIQDKFGGKIDYNDEVVAVTPDGFHVRRDDVYQATFFSRSPYVKKFTNILTGLELLERNEVPHFRDWEETGFPGLYLDQLTFNAHQGGNGAVTKNGGASQPWSTAHDAAAGDSVNVNATHDVNSGIGGSANFIITRGFYPFDVSSIPGSATVTTEVFSLYITAKLNGDNDGKDYINVYRTTQADMTSLATGDFDQLGTTAGSTAIDIGDITTSAYNDWTLNATAKAWSSGVYRPLGIREGHDAEDNEYAGAGNTYNNVTVTSSYSASNKPKLVVTYSLPGGSYTFYF